MLISLEEINGFKLFRIENYMVKLLTLIEDGYYHELHEIDGGHWDYVQGGCRLEPEALEVIEGSEIMLGARFQARFNIESCMNAGDAIMREAARYGANASAEFVTLDDPRVPKRRIRVIEDSSQEKQPEDGKWYVTIKRAILLKSRDAAHG
jgi:hypothetical protein